MSVDALVRGVAAGQQPAGQQQAFARLPCRRPRPWSACRGRRAGSTASVHVEHRPVVEGGRVELRGPAAVEHEMRMARRRAIGNHRDRLATPHASGSRGSSRRAPSRARPGPARRCRARSPCRRARAAAPRSRLAGRAPISSCMSIGSIMRLLREQHRLFGGAADAERRACPAGTSPRPSSARSTAPSRRSSRTESA